VIGIEIGKNWFHVVGHDKRGAIGLRQKWSRGQLEARLANTSPCLAGVEACRACPTMLPSAIYVRLQSAARIAPSLLRRWRPTGGGDVFADREGQAQGRGSQAWLVAVLARLPDHPAKRIHETLALELASAEYERASCLDKSSTRRFRITHTRGLYRTRTVPTLPPGTIVIIGQSRKPQGQGRPAAVTQRCRAGRTRAEVPHIPLDLRTGRRSDQPAPRQMNFSKRHL
jgi:hypothetical protein